MDLSFPSPPVTWNAEVKAEVSAAILDYEDKGEPGGARMLMTEAPSYQSWTTYSQTFLPERNKLPICVSYFIWVFHYIQPNPLLTNHY